MKHLLLSTEFEVTTPVGAAAKTRGMRVSFFDEDPDCTRDDDIIYYGGSDVAIDAARKFNLCLLEPDLDLLANIPERFIKRGMECINLDELQFNNTPLFIKPADPLNKAFDVGIYSYPGQIRHVDFLPSNTLILVSEPVEWLSEFRIFCRNREVAAVSPYLSFGRPNWKPFHGRRRCDVKDSRIHEFARSFLREYEGLLPPAFVMDVGLIENAGWAIVEFNPIWCAGILGADPRIILDLLSLTSRSRRYIEKNDCERFCRAHVAASTRNGR